MMLHCNGHAIHSPSSAHDRPRALTSSEWSICGDQFFGLALVGRARLGSIFFQPRSVARVFNSECPFDGFFRGLVPALSVHCNLDCTTCIFTYYLWQRQNTVPATGVTKESIIS